MFMDKDTPMSEPPNSDPEGNLENLFAAEEAAIKDEGFTAQVMQDVRGPSPWRRPVIYGAAFIGAGFALGGLTKLAPRLQFEQWIAEARSAIDASVGQATTAVGLAQGSAGVPDTVLITGAALVAGAACLLAALTLQTR